MKRVLPLLVLLVLASGLKAASVPPELVDKLQAATVMVVTPSGMGSGVVMRTDDGTPYVWTAAHVVPPDTEIKVIQGDTALEAQLVWRSDEIEAALVRVSSTKLPRGVSWGDAVVGTEVVHAGFFGGPPIGFTRGIVSWQGTDQQPDGATVPLGPGSSGGGLFDAEGRCIGLVFRVVSCAISVFTPARQIRETLPETCPRPGFRKVTDSQRRCLSRPRSRWRR